MIKKIIFCAIISVCFLHGVACADSDCKGAECLIGKCDDKRLGDTCSQDGVSGVAKGSGKTTQCIYAKQSAKSEPMLTCAALDCNNGFLLWLRNGVTQGVCHKREYAEKECTKVLSCSNDSVAIPKIVPNPNAGYNDNKAYDGCKCPEKVDSQDPEIVDKPDCRSGDQYYDSDSKTCMCTDSKKEINSDGNCVCKAGFETQGDGSCLLPDKNINEDESEIPVNGGVVDCELPRENINGDCACPAPKTIYVETSNTCECPEGQMEEDGKCVSSTTGGQNDGENQKEKCPDDATGIPPNCECTDTTKQYDVNKNECVINKLPELQDAYDAAKENEQSWENRLLTAATTAATGFGGMELAQGLAEQKADEAAAADMAAYIATMRCTYGDGTSVRAGLTPVELPGGNNNEMRNLRIEYDALAESVKNRKESLGMAPGIESEVILDKANMGLYDNENTGITGGHYSSLYRADMLNSETDKTQIKSDQETSQNRVDYGGQAAGVGAIVGTVGNIAINSDLGDLFKKDK